MGLALLWKNRGPGSQDLLGNFKRELALPGKSRTGIGHTGTLDPFAEGLLLVGFGEGTKIISPLVGLPKTYEATLFLGVSSDSLDDTGTLQWLGTPELEAKLKAITEAQLSSFLAGQLGTFEQIPPQLSAIHVDGKRAHEWAREGVVKEMKPRSCELLAAEHLGWEIQTREAHSVGAWRFRVRVSSGTYVRSFARDWGEALVGSPGLLSRLVRSEIGPFGFPAGAQGFARLNLNDLAAHFGRREISDGQAQDIRKFGRWTPVGPLPRPELLVAPGDQLIAWIEPSAGALGRVFLEDPLAWPA
ncbi:MAG: hypothetical protein JST16_08635 [Bdellovibrionales bacterium]|nr:hypothetical protein [Bdellovibrionales bacterium]